MHLENDCYPGITHFNLCGYIIAHTFLLFYVHFSFDAIFIEMKQQRLVMLYLGAIEQIKKIKVNTVVAFILNYVTV